MVVLAVDDEKIALERLVDAIGEAVPGAEIFPFRSAEEALESAAHTPYDVAFLDIQLRVINGVELARRLKVVCPKVNIIFTTGYSEYSMEAFAIHASGYLLKPITTKKVLKELEDLRFPVAYVAKDKLRVQTFGNFEVYAGGEPLWFRYSKTKEMFAYLVDRQGALCPNRQLMAVLWEDAEEAPKDSYFQNIRHDLISTLREAGYLDVIIRQPGKIGIQTQRIECDYYEWLEKKDQSGGGFRGEYMAQYSWSEFTLGRLEEELRRIEATV